MNQDIQAKVNSLKHYLEKDPDAATEIALHFYQAFLELSPSTQTSNQINPQLLPKYKRKTISLPSFLHCSRH